MKKYTVVILTIFSCLSLSGCAIVETSFKAGFIMALVLAAIVGLLIWVFHIGRAIVTRYFPNVRLMFQDFWDE